jgi:hypothetical protein
MSFFNADEILSNFLHAALAIPFGISALMIAAHVASRLV